MTDTGPARPLWLSVLTSTWIKIGLAAAVIYALVAFNRIELQSFAGLSRNWPWLLSAFLLMLPPYLLVSYRFWRVLRIQGIRVDFRLALRWTMIGSFFDVAMPSSSGGDVVKAGYIARHVGAGMRVRAVMAVAFDRVLGLIGLFLLAAGTSVVGWTTVRAMRGSGQLMAFLLLISLASLLFFRVLGSRRLYNHPRLRRLLDRAPGGQRLLGVIGCFNSLREQPRDLATVLALSMFNHVFWCGSLLCIAAAFGYRVGLVSGFTVFPLAIFGNVFGVAGGFGVGTAAFDLIFLQLLSIPVGAAIGLTFQTLGVLVRLLGLPFYLMPAPPGATHLPGRRPDPDRPPT